MEENEGTQICPNCNREIPKVNFMIHSVHCVRNIKTCPVCKEPVMQSELDDHIDKLHQLVPCRQCGEMVRGADMEDHTRDSCAFTIQPCRYCSLELPRRDAPSHDRYCGSRTEYCHECGQFVMLRYRQLHLDSNHGFVRLREDSPPRPSTGAAGDSVPGQPAANRRPKFPQYVPLANFVRPSVTREQSLRLIAQCRARYNATDPEPQLSDEHLRHRIIASIPLLYFAPERRVRGDDGMNRLRARERFVAELRGQTTIRDLPPLEDLDREVLRHAVDRNAEARRQLNPDEIELLRDGNGVLARDMVEVGAEEAAPAEAAAAPGAVDAGEAAAVDMTEDEEDEEEFYFNLDEGRVFEASANVPPRHNSRVMLKRTNDQPQINTTSSVHDKTMKKLAERGAVKKRAAPSPRLPRPASPPPSPDPRRDLPYYSALQRRQDEDRCRREQTAYNLSVGLPPVLDPAAKLEKLRKMDALHNRDGQRPDYRQRLARSWNNNNEPADTRNTSAVPQASDVEQQRRQLADLQPMSAEEFMERFNELQLMKEPVGNGGAAGENGTRGRFGDIRSSLRELRRGLNEVTAPYNNSANNNNNTNKNNNIIDGSTGDIPNGAGAPHTAQLDEARALDSTEGSPEADVMVPCEFCCEPLRASEILDHERACRQELAASPSSPARSQSPWDDDNIPVIPCEFCTKTLPFYLLNDHQEKCGRESDLLYPD